MTRERADEKHIKGSLDALAGGLGFSDEAKGFIEGAYRSRQGLQTATEIYGQMHLEEKNQVNGNDLKNLYSGSIFEGISDADKTTFENRLTAHGDETYGDIARKYRLAATKVQAPEGDYSDQEVVDARQTLEEYQRFMQTDQELEDYQLESLRAQAINAGRIRHLNELAKAI